MAVDKRIAEWFSGWPLVQGDAPLDWEQLLKSVESLRYSVVFGEKIHLTVKLDCKDSPTATALTQAFQGFRLLQAWSWQKHNPNQANPIEAVDIQSSQEEVVVGLTTSESTIRNASLFSPRTEQQ